MRRGRRTCCFRSGAAMIDKERLKLIFDAEDAWTESDDLYPQVVLDAIHEARKGWREGKRNETPMMKGME